MDPKSVGTGIGPNGFRPYTGLAIGMPAHSLDERAAQIRAYGFKFLGVLISSLNSTGPKKGPRSIVALTV